MNIYIYGIANWLKSVLISESFGAKGRNKWLNPHSWPLNYLKKLSQ